MANIFLQQHFLIVEDEKNRRKIPPNEVSYTIGRKPRCDLFLRSQSPLITKHHATLQRKQNDNGSFYYQIIAENTFADSKLLINNRRLTSHNLQHQDKIVFSPQVFAIYYTKHHDYKH